VKSQRSDIWTDISVIRDIRGRNVFGFTGLAAARGIQYTTRQEVQMNGERIRRGFTLIEMLAVIAIIAILAGIVFKMMTFANRKAADAKTIAILEKVANALAEFKAEYGQYPPVVSNACPLSGPVSGRTDVNGATHPADCRVCYSFFPKMPANRNFESQVAYLKAYTNYNASTIYGYGLVGFLMERGISIYSVPPSGVVKVGDMAQWVPDTARDQRAKRRWSPFLENVIGGPYDDLKLQILSGQGSAYFNMFYTIYDGYYPNEKPIVYKCDPPYQTYELWAAGPDRVYGTSDDTHRATWDNK
jgi:prepilin-type N-terminal cleavage/methylation domain-containing protein